MLTEVKIDISYDFFFSIIQNTIDYIESVPNFKWKAIVVGILASVGKCTHPPILYRYPEARMLNRVKLYRVTQWVFWNMMSLGDSFTAQKMKFSITDFFIFVQWFF